MVWGKGKSNSSLFAKDVIIYLEIPKELIEKVVELMRVLEKVLRARKYSKIISSSPYEISHNQLGNGIAGRENQELQHPLHQTELRII